VKSSRRKIYWDNTCWLAWLNGEGTETWPASVVQGIKDVVVEVEANRAVLFTSAVTRGEIFEGKLTREQKEMYAGLMRRKNVVEVNADAKVFTEASRIREYHANQQQKRRIQLPDATHLATAIIYRADEFQTMDGLCKGGESKRKLMALSGDVGGHHLKIVQPYPLNAPPPPELVVIEGPLLQKAMSDSKPDKAKATDEGGPNESGSKLLKWSRRDSNP
jgi:predicted nucleic acid-binding protein